MTDEQHIEMMAAVIAAGMFVDPQYLRSSDEKTADIALGIADAIIRQNREPKP